MNGRTDKSTLFGSDLWIGHQILILVEGEWDCMLCWQLASDLADFATLGDASHRASFIDLASLAKYPQIVAVYDADSAGDQARRYLSSLPRLHTVTPPAHTFPITFALVVMLLYGLNPFSLEIIYSPPLRALRHPQTRLIGQW